MCKLSVYHYTESAVLAVQGQDSAAETELWLVCALKKKKIDGCCIVWKCRPSNVILWNWSGASAIVMGILIRAEVECGGVTLAIKKS